MYWLVVELGRTQVGSDLRLVNWLVVELGVPTWAATPGS